jgi:peptide/nickel transport system ATP-binding protein
VAVGLCRSVVPELKPRASDRRRVACHVAQGEAMGEAA